MSHKLSRRDFFTSFLKRWQTDEKKQPSGFTPTLLQADKHLANQEYRKALEYYLAYLQTEPNQLGVLKKCGYCYFRLHEFEQARKFFQKAMAIRPKEQFCILYQGLSYAYEGDLEQAIATWKAYFNLDTPLIQREINVLIGLYETGEELDYQQVVQDVEKAIASQNSNESN